MRFVFSSMVRKSKSVTEKSMRSINVLYKIHRSNHADIGKNWVSYNREDIDVSLLIVTEDLYEYTASILSPENVPLTGGIYQRVATALKPIKQNRLTCWSIFLKCLYLYVRCAPKKRAAESTFSVQVLEHTATFATAISPKKTSPLATVLMIHSNTYLLKSDYLRRIKENFWIIQLRWVCVTFNAPQRNISFEDCHFNSPESIRSKAVSAETRNSNFEHCHGHKNLLKIFFNIVCQVFIPAIN
jgi:hypothetical protein